MVYIRNRVDLWEQLDKVDVTEYQQTSAWVLSKNAYTGCIFSCGNAMPSDC